MINHSKKAIFVHVPKTAGTSMRMYFGRRGFGSVEYHAPDGSNDDVTGLYKIGTSRRIKRNLEDVWDSYFKFAFVRNPWDRMVSCWKNRAGKYNDFSKFLNDYPYPARNHNLIWHTIPQLDHIRDENKNIMMDFIGKFENIDNDLKYICDKLNINHNKLPHQNTSNHKPYYEYYTEQQMMYVGDIYREEIEMFNYEFGK